MSVSGGQVSAVGGPRANGAGNGYMGAGGDGRIRVDAPSLLVNGSSATTTVFAAQTTPSVGFFGSAAPSASVTTPPTSSGAVAISYSVSDADSNFLFVDVEVSVNGGAFVSARPSSSSERTFAVSSSPSGTSHVFTWDSAADLGAGTRSIVVRVRPVAATPGAWVTSGAFTVNN